MSIALADGLETGHLNVRRSGAGRPLLFLHGAYGLAGWPSALAELADRYHVIAPDHPGFGSSALPDGLDDVGDLAYFYLGLVERLALGPVHVVGECLGGWIALEMAIRSTASIASITLCGAAGIRIRGAQPADLFRASPPELAELMFSGQAAQEWLAAWQSSPEQEDVYERNRAAAARFCWQPRLHDPKLERWLHRIDVPARILWGARDRVLPPVYAERLGELIAGSQVTVFPDCGHVVHADCPRAFVDATDAFIAGVAA